MKTFFLSCLHCGLERKRRRVPTNQPTNQPVPGHRVCVAYQSQGLREKPKKPTLFSPWHSLHNPQARWFGRKRKNGYLRGLCCEGNKKPFGKIGGQKTHLGKQMEGTNTVYVHQLTFPRKNVLFQSEFLDPVTLVNGGFFDNVSARILLGFHARKNLPRRRRHKQDQIWKINWIHAVAFSLFSSLSVTVSFSHSTHFASQKFGENREVFPQVHMRPFFPLTFGRDTLLGRI